MTREEIVKALRCFGHEENCPVDACNGTCPYWMEDGKFDLGAPEAEISDEHQLCRAPPTCSSRMQTQNRSSCRSQ